MSRTVITYTTVWGNSTYTLDAEVGALLQEGWNLYGDPRVIHNGYDTVHFQTLIREIIVDEGRAG